MLRTVTVLVGAVVCLTAASVAQPTSPASFDSRGVRIHYEVRNSGTPVVLLHGFTGSAQRHFGQTGVIDALVAAGYRVVAMDSRGHGESGKPRDPGAYGLEMAEDVLRLLDHLQIQRVHVVGYSMGGAIATQLLVRHPERLLTTALLGSGWEGEDPKEFRSQMLAMAEGFDKKDASALIRGVRSGAEAAPTETEVAALNAELFSRNPPDVLAAVARGMLPLWDVSANRLRASKVPVIAIVGEHDTSNLIAAKRMATVINGLELVVIPGATHQSVRVSTAPLVAFLQKHRN
jgi:pimeloyl-ACP methyl ester carboxylesterase